MGNSNPPSSPSGADNTGASNDIDEILNDLLAEFGHPHEYMMRPVQELAYKAAIAAIQNLIAQETNKARINENEYWRNRAHIQIATKGKPLLRLKYFDDRIAQLTADKESKE